MDNYIIIIPTHKRHEYLAGKIQYYSVFPCQVYIFDSSPNEYKPEVDLPSNIHYHWCPGKGFYAKVLYALSITDAHYYNLTPDDDFLDINTIIECYEKMKADTSIALSVGKQVMFNKPYDGRFFRRQGANKMLGIQLGSESVKNASLVGRHYQNVLWSMYRKDVILSAFTKLENVNPGNGNFIELTLAMEACVGGNIFITSNPMNYREHSIEEHWGNQVECISAKNLSRNERMKLDMDRLLATYYDEDKAVAHAFIEAYLKIEGRWTVPHILKAIKRRLIKSSDMMEEQVYSPVEQILLLQKCD